METYLASVWYAGQRPPPLILRGLERLHQGLGHARFHRPRQRPPVPVIVVGNLCVGGGGKTPTVIALSQALDPDRRVVVISRGYGGRPRDCPMSVEPDSPVVDCGDEALLIRRTAEVPVIVDPDRARALSFAIDHFGAQVVISDDGLQHRSLARSFEICLFDGSRGVGNGRLLPAGPLRQPLGRLDEVDQVLIKGEGMDWPGALRFELEPVGLRALNGGFEPDLAAWRGRAVDAFCALANPGQFTRTLEALSLSVRMHPFPDHHYYGPDDLRGLSGPLLTTAKDAVKLGDWAQGLDVHVLEVAARLPAELVARVRRHVEEFEMTTGRP
jgi:tetraacyldisaccharide 4'-kinase